MSENNPRPYKNVTEVVSLTLLVRLNSVARDVPGPLIALGWCAACP